ncbi:hypothetical protein AYK21_05320 [Thermoplasmatales archaeon SG8-52-2]|nr:MAG: hypothetical protein AYK21_05320 [Thermoplasmatales archaeon SG8-52-2]
MNRALLKNIILIVIPIIVILLVGAGLVGTGIISTQPLRLDSKTINATLIIDYGEKVVDTYILEISNATVYSLLIQASNQYDFEVGSYYYDNYQSHYIYSINNFVEGNNNKFWQYYINGEYGIVGADLQGLKNRDIVEWKFQEPKI